MYSPGIRWLIELESFTLWILLTPLLAITTKSFDFHGYPVILENKQVVGYVTRAKLQTAIGKELNQMKVVILRIYRAF